MKNPYSLLSRVMQSKYYPCIDFSLAPLVLRPSYVWKSVLATRPHLLQGMRWQIGNGCMGNGKKMSSNRILTHMMQKQYSRCHCMIVGPGMSNFGLIIGQGSSWYARLISFPNVPTRSLVTKAASTDPSNVWIEVEPHRISSAVQADLI
ncbi:hypothetical protein M9H77_12370 [Catharanthus roseus]|uniref:Uncharacterized protein n=1 Tax=Catharanthus roseus TaxID=4058 RepID=A0ACC0BH87_CATRO|nr:hypothetical protein M9H77_12370 [Catharanthus roseus]